MHAQKLLPLFVLTLIAMMAANGFSQTEPVIQWATPLDKSAEFVKAAQNATDEMLAAIRPKTPAKVSSFVTKEGCFVLHGDLFSKGESMALLELVVDVKNPTRGGSAVVGLARFNAGQWELCALLNISTVWRPRGWKESESDHLHITPAERPFELKDLSGDDVPELIVAGEVEKYYQQHYVFLWSDQKKNLTYAAAAMSMPEYVGGYVRLYFNSGRRAIWGRYEFHQWDGENLVQKASWHDEVPYTDPDKSFTRVTRTQSNGEDVEFELKELESDVDMKTVYSITRQEKPFARVTFEWPKALNTFISDGFYPSEVETAYLFEKLTGLPRKLDPHETQNTWDKPVEKLAKIRVEGEPSAIKLLSPQR